MAKRVLTAREFNQDVSRAKRAANGGAVIITDRGKPAYVLLRHDAYRRLVGRGPGLRELLAHPESADIDFEPQRPTGPLARPADLD
jgi:antitoxin (DNA-binding transcriptional repressor) of toxin-antitoxin stability system